MLPLYPLRILDIGLKFGGMMPGLGSNTYLYLQIQIQIQIRRICICICIWSNFKPCICICICIWSTVFGVFDKYVFKYTYFMQKFTMYTLLFPINKWTNSNLYWYKSIFSCSNDYWCFIFIFKAMSSETVTVSLIRFSKNVQLISIFEWMSFTFTPRIFSTIQT